MLITIVAGARPNFMKISPIIRAIKRFQSEGLSLTYRLVHTGQHFDHRMSHSFFEQLNIPAPDINLECGGGSQAEQTASIMIKFEKELQLHKPELVLVVGDVTSTMACTITAKKLCIDVAHVEAGIRSGDMTMPEEINRIVTDSLCDHFFTTTRGASLKLQQNGINPEKIHFVGNTMIDTLHQNLERIRKPPFWEEAGLDAGNFILLTLHRPSNVDDPDKLKSILDEIMSEAGEIRIVFPVHPRTKQVIEKMSWTHPSLIQIEPQGYLEFIYLLRHSAGVVTDSGGITEEATVLDIPCMTLRNSTERPETVEVGTNELIGSSPEKIREPLKKMLAGKWKKGSIPELWDGKTSERIVQRITEIYEIAEKIKVPV